MTTDIVIPVRDQLQYTESIVMQLEKMEGWNHCWIFDNGSVDETWDWLKTWSLYHPKFSILPAEGKTIYEIWDFGFVTSRFADHVLYLNNDVKLHPETIIWLNQALEAQDDHWIAYPDYNAHPNNRGRYCNYRYTAGTYRHGGMSGYCFMLKQKKITWSPLVDLDFQWWAGDDDLAFNVEKHGGRQVRVVGLPIEHVNEGTARFHNLGEQKAADLKRCIEKWGR